MVTKENNNYHQGRCLVSWYWRVQIPKNVWRGSVTVTGWKVPPGAAKGPGNQNTSLHGISVPRQVSSQTAHLLGTLSPSSTKEPRRAHASELILSASPLPWVLLPTSANLTLTLPRRHKAGADIAPGAFGLKASQIFPHSPQRQSGHLKKFQLRIESGLSHLWWWLNRCYRFLRDTGRIPNMGAMNP